MANKAAVYAAACGRAAGWTGDTLAVAVAIAGAESSWNPRATNQNTNGSSDFGLWQINSIHKPTDKEKTDGAANAKKAHKVWSDAGGRWTPWVTFNTGAYKKFLPEAKIAAEEAMKMDKGTLEKIADTVTSGLDKVTPDNLPSVPNPADGIGGAVDKLTAFGGKVVNNMILLFIALVCIVLGIVILARGAGIRAGKGLVKGVVKDVAKDVAKGTRKTPAPAPRPQPVRTPATRPAPKAPPSPPKVAPSPKPAAPVAKAQPTQAEIIAALKARGNELAPKAK